MRPVRLDLAGFASFREPATVDFTDADHFALVGPTGSGKSTVIDAMTFALYGSVPRWGRSTAIADALAPTTNRCTVRLVFDVGNARYVVAREVRRVGRTVQQKNAVLERLPAGADPAGEDQVTGELVAGDLREVTRAVENLLGLSFSDFCQCVVLPQGRFAEFLGATGRERQEILLKLLGAGLYETIQKAAASRAALAGERMTVLTAQLGDLATATEAAQTAAGERESALAQLAVVVDKALPSIADAQARVAAGVAEQARLVDERDRLAAETMPAGVADLQAVLDGAERERVAAAGHEAAAVDRDAAARADRDAGPGRPGLEVAIERHDELAGLLAGRDRAASEAAAAAARQEAAEAAVTTAGERVGLGRDRREAARQTRADAGAALDRLTDRRTRLRAALPAPEGISGLDARTTGARQALEAARAGREQAETADRQARDAVRAAPARGPLEQVLRALADRAGAQADLDRLTGEAAALDVDLDRAAAVVEQRRHRLDAATAAHDRTTRADSADLLRPHLVAGEPCPVCDQPVATLPPARVPSAAERTAAAAVETARDALAAAQQQAALASRAEAGRSAEALAARQRLESVAGWLDGPGRQVAPAGQAGAELARLDALVAAEDEAAERVSAARQSEAATAAELAELDRQAGSAWSQLRAVHGPLIALGAPTLDDADLSAGLHPAWATLTGWAGEQVADLEAGHLPRSRTELTRADDALIAAARTVTASEGELEEAQAEHTRAVATAAATAAAAGTISDRIAALRKQLRGAPTAVEAAAQRARCDELDAAVARCDGELRAARAARIAAQGEWDRHQTRAGQARRALRTARDRLVPLGAPQIDDTDLAAAWAALLTWADGESRARAQQLPDLAARIARADGEREAETAVLHQLFSDHDLDTRPGEPPTALPTRVASALAGARAESARIAGERSRAAGLDTRLAAAREQQQVARLLADLLRSDRFPRWLAAAALDTLVTDASAVLSDLSGGQFDLSHEKGEFVVIDHSDADSRRSVRTLSGGETFQASLALALALSAQMSTLAAEGAARLDSIFLDEGFGTLDPETLETVAATLENLAHGERMVGVITHVAALAERAPVRFAVRRDHLTSSITRESP